jgi:DNA replication protein DnaC
MEEGHIPLKYQDAEFSMYVDRENERSKQALVSYVAKMEENRRRGLSLYLQGTHGSGKTYLVNALLKEAIRRGFTVRFITFDMLVTLFTGTWSDPEVKREFERDVMRVDFLAVDECVKRTNVGIDLARTAFDATFRDRSNALMPIFLTSNEPLDLQALTGGGNLFGENLLSLFSEHMITLTFVGADYRPSIGRNLRDSLKS